MTQAFDFLAIPHWEGIAVILGFIVFPGGAWLLKKMRKKTNEPSRQNTIYAEPKNELFALAERFRLIYKSHSIESPQIPKFVDRITLENLSNNEKLVAALEEQTLVETCEKFNIQQDWLEGKDVPIYSSLTFYKQLRNYVDFIISLKEKHRYLHGIAIKCTEDKLDKNGPDLGIVLLFQASIDDWEQNTGEPIWKYYVIQDEYSWSYRKTRLQLKAMIYIAHAFDIFVAGCELNNAEIGLLAKGKTFPGPLIEEKSHVAWHPTEYIFTHDESGAVRDNEEVKDVREFIGKDLMQYLIKQSGPIRVFK